MVFSGGGTGGHLYPALALADALESMRPDVRCVFVGARKGLEASVLPDLGREHVLVPIRGIERGRFIANVAVVPALLRSLWAVRRLFRRIRPEVVVVTGGYAGAPAGILAGWSGIPLVLQEQNAVPGVTTRLLARRAETIHAAFPEAARHLSDRAADRVVDSGNPVRPPEDRDPAEARAAFGLPPEGPVVLVVGGSQGSRALNRLLGDVVRGLGAGGLRRPPGASILWQTGSSHIDAVRASMGEVPPFVRLEAYIHDMPGAFAAADVAVSRAGAMTTSEMLAWGLPMVLVPLPTAAADHQSRNARALEEAGAAVALSEEGLAGAELWSAVTAMLDHPDELAKRRAAAKARARPHAAHEIARSLLRFLPAQVPGGPDPRPEATP